MGIDVETRAGIAILSPDRDLDITELPAVEARVAALLGEGVRHLVWDLGAVGVLPSTAAGLLLQTVRRVRDVGGRMVLARCAPRTVTTLRTMGVLSMFRTYPSVAAAVASFEP